MPRPYRRNEDWKKCHIEEQADDVAVTIADREAAEDEFLDREYENE